MSSDIDELRLLALRGRAAAAEAEAALDRLSQAVAQFDQGDPAVEQQGDEAAERTAVATALRQSVAALQRSAQPPLVFPTDVATLRRLLNEYDPEGRTG
jgi:HAMP domain-containing protein